MDDKKIYIRARYTKELQDNFYYFVRQSWDIVNPSPEDKFVDIPLIKIICNHLQATSEGEIKRLAISIPPGFCKSLLSSVFFPAWIWTKDPSARFITGSYSLEFATRDAKRARDLIKSHWYQYLWGWKVKLEGDQDKKTNYQTDAKGYRFVFGTSSAYTGARADYIIVDDALKVQEAYSKLARESVGSLVGNLNTRLVNPLTGKIILVGQRLHPDDPIGRALHQRNGKWEYLCMPLEGDRKRRCKTIIFEDTREEGESLWPERFTSEVIKSKIEDMGSRDYNAQYQQNPLDDKGQILRREWWKYYRESPSMNFILQSWDTAFKKGDENDYSVCTTWGRTDTGFYLLDRWKERVEFPDLKKMLVALAAKYKPNQILIEDHASGQSLIQELKRESTLPIRAIRVDKDKITRAHAVAPLLEAGKIFVPEATPWLIDYLDNLAGFPNMEHDDEVDSTTMALNFMNNMYREPSIRSL